MEFINEYEAEERFNEMLDDCYPLIESCGLTINPSRFLSELDPTAWRCSLLDWLDSENLTTDEAEAEADE